MTPVAEYTLSGQSGAVTAQSRASQVLPAPSSPAHATSLLTQPREDSQETSTKPGCGCGPDAELTTLGSLATHCNQLLVRWAVALKHRKILSDYTE